MPIRDIEGTVNEVNEGLREASDTAEQIAEARELQSSILEGIRVPEAKDMEAIRAAASEAHEEAAEDYEARVTEPMDELAGESRDAQDEAGDEAREAAEGARQLEGAESAAPYGAAGIERAVESATETEEELRELQASAQEALEEYLAQAARNEGRI